jgi:hypothetical protein
MWTGQAGGKGGQTGRAALVTLAACAGLLQVTPVQAQGYKALPESSQAIRVQPPSPDQLFRVESEATLRERMRQEARSTNAPQPFFPPEPPPEPYFAGRSWPHRVALAEPSYVCYGRLLFEQINGERYGWDLGALHPLVSLGVFYLDVATLPYHLATEPCRCYECSAGYCLPGDPVPLLLYLPQCSATGALAEAAAIAVVLVAFP